MADEVVKCPKCGTEIPVSAILRQKIETELKSDTAQKIKQAKEAGKREATQELELEVADLNTQITEKEEALKQAKATELKLRKRERALQEKEENLELEIEKRLTNERSEIRKEIEKKVETRHELALRTRDEKIERLKKDLAETQRRAEQGSVQEQGEIFEKGLEEALRKSFTNDTIEPVPKGVKGPDVMQTVIDGGRNCGVILWECKRTKAWNNNWVGKLKEDQREVGAAISIIVSQTLPKDIDTFGLLDGVWVTSYETAMALAMALRESLMEISLVRVASEGKDQKMEAIYNYLIGQEFRQKVMAIVEAFVTMKADLDKEKRAMTSIWKKREKQIEMIVKSTSGMYGDIRAIAGSSVKEIRQLELEEVKPKELPSS